MAVRYDLIPAKWWPYLNRASRGLDADLESAGGGITFAEAKSSTLDADMAAIHSLILAGATKVSLKGGVDGSVVAVVLVQDSVGGHAVTWDSSINWAATPTLVTTATKASVVTLVRLGDLWYASLTGTGYQGPVVTAPEPEPEPIPVPSLTSITPNKGIETGGTSVVLTGTNLIGATSVRFGTTQATSLTVNSATSITAVSPAHAPGSTTISVTTPGGTSNGVAYTYEVEPVTPPPTGGTGTLIFRDTFTDTNGTSLTAHAPDTGVGLGPWRAPTSANNRLSGLDNANNTPSITGNRPVAPSGQIAGALITTNVNKARVVADFDVSGGSGTNDRTNLYFGSDTSFILISARSNRVVVYRDHLTSGEVYSDVVGSPIATTGKLEVGADGTTLWAKVNDTTIWSAPGTVDGTLAGFAFAAGTSRYLDNFEVYAL